MLYVDFNLDRIKAAIAAPPEDSSFILPNHDKIVDALRAGDPASLPLEERLIVFSYLRNAVYGSAKRNEHYIDQLYIHPFAGNFSYDAICEPIYHKEISVMQAISNSIDYSDRLKSKIGILTEKLFDELFSIEEFRNSYSLWSYHDSNTKMAHAYGFLYQFAQVAAELFPWPMQHTNFYAIDQESLLDTRMLLRCCDPEDTLNFPSHYIAGHPKILDELPARRFFYTLHHEAIHGLLYQMMAAYQMGRSADENYKEDAKLKFLSVKYNFADIASIQSLYFSNCEEKICMANDDRAWEKLGQLDPSMQLTHSLKP